MGIDHDRFMQMALDEAGKALGAGNVPVGSLIVRHGEVLGIGQNRVLSTSDPTAHAEVDAVRDACRKLGSPDLAGATCYTTMEPCPMCCWALQAAGVAGLVLGARHAGLRRREYGDYSVEALLGLTKRNMELVTGVLVAECEAIRRDWQARQAPQD